jgi:glycosyltransferase involved in cell wall biosynthesis
MSKRILIITDNLPEQINGVVTTYKNIEPYALRDGYTVDYIHPGCFRYVDCPVYHEVKLAAPVGLRQKIQEISPDYIHIATEGPMGVYARKHLTALGYRYNTAYHTKFPEAIKKLTHIPEMLTWPLIRWFHKRSHRVLTTTESMVESLHEHGFGDNVIPWTRGVDRETFWPFKHRWEKDKPILVNVGRVSEEKNLEEFYRLDIDAKKIQVGDGPMLETYKKRYPDVEFVGAKTGRDLAHYYQHSDVFVFPSKWDTFGIVMIESMACGTPVAAYPVQGPVDVIDQGITGIMDNDLKTAVEQALKLNREDVYLMSAKWSWEHAWEIFRDNLIEK